LGIKERHERDREAVRRAILDAARDLFVTEGFENASIRKIAERIEYSPAAIYSYFPGKDEIFFALAEEGFRLLSDVAPDESARCRALPPVERVRAGFWHLYEFARQHPQYFALIFLDRSVPRISHEYRRFAFARAGREQLVDDVRQCIESKVFAGAVDPQGVVRLLSMGLIGVAAARLSNRLSRPEEADQFAVDMLDVLLSGLQAGASVGAGSETVMSPES
jgi:AcrR family transcriptional regulator